MSQTLTATSTYSTADIQIVMRRFTADLLMIANSTKAVTEQTARKWAHDVELLAAHGYLNAVDLTLLSYGVEQKAVRFNVNTQAGDLSMSRPGGVLWPQVANPDLRIILFYTAAYTAAAEKQLENHLEVSWSSTNADTTHSSLNSTQGRDYVSNGYGMQRKDFNK